MKRIPTLWYSPPYSHVPAKDLPPYQLFKRWQKATGVKSMGLFGTLSEKKMLADIKKHNPKLLNPIRKVKK